jgi:hypothetical protein
MTRKETAIPIAKDMKMKIFETKRSKPPDKQWWNHQDSSEEEKPMKRSEYQSKFEISSESEDDVELSQRVMDNWYKNRKSKGPQKTTRKSMVSDFDEEKQEVRKINNRHKRSRPKKSNKEKYEDFLEGRNPVQNKGLQKRPDVWENKRVKAKKNAEMGVWKRYKVEPTTPNLLKRQIEAGR